MIMANVNKKIEESNFDKILNPDLSLDEKKMYYEDLLIEAIEKNNIELQIDIKNILDELKSRGDCNEN